MLQIFNIALTLKLIIILKKTENAKCALNPEQPLSEGLQYVAQSAEPTFRN